MPRGGARPGAGKPKGYKHQKTREKETAAEVFRRRIVAEWNPLIDAELDIAKGLTVIFAREWETQKVTGRKTRSGRFVRITSPAEIEDLLNNSVDGDDYYRLTTQDPDVRMLVELNARVMGKVADTVALTGADGGPVRVQFVDV
jgi:hypothetical protein